MPKEVVVDESKKPSEELSNVQVQLDENNQPVKQEEKKQEESKYVTPEMLAASLGEAIKKATAPLYYELRQSRQQAPAQAAPVQPKPEPTEWDVKLQKDWKGTVEELAEARVQSILQKREEAQRMEFERQRTIQLLNENKQRVLDKHKELNDETSDKANVYREILSQHPEYLSNPFGPVLAMRDMEDKLRESGYIDESTKQVVNREVVRQTRANAGGIPKGSANPSNGKTITLTKEQKEYCDSAGIKYQDYVKYASMTAKNGGVEA